MKDKVAIVTGSSRGIGAAIAKALASAGAKVAVNYVASREQGQKTVDEIAAAGGRAILVRANATVREEVVEMVRGVEAELGPVDILVNNASIEFPVVPFSEYPWHAYEQKVTGEAKASFFTCQAVIPGMIERRGGCIVNVSSTLSRSPGPGFVAHSSAKSGLDSFSKSLALEMGPHGIRVNVVAPGLTLTDATRGQPKQFHEAITAHTPLRRLAEPEDVAAAVAFLCSAGARHVTGVYLPVCGGAHMS